jgi:hypothetical protein
MLPGLAVVFEQATPMDITKSKGPNSARRFCICITT